LGSLAIHPDKPSRAGTEGQLLVAQIRRDGTSGRVPSAISTSRSLNTVLHEVPVPSGVYEVHSSINSCETYWDSAATNLNVSFSPSELLSADESTLTPPNRRIRAFDLE